MNHESLFVNLDVGAREMTHAMAEATWLGLVRVGSAHNEWKSTRSRLIDG